MNLDSRFSTDDAVAAVDPADLHNVWAMQREAQVNYPNQGIAIDMDFYQRACGPGADTDAVWYRVSMLHLLAGPVGLLTPWLHDGELADAVFQVAATFPMKRPPVGVPQQGLPFDVQAFLELIEKRNNQ
jgi:hypothetical protein